MMLNSNEIPISCNNCQKKYDTTTIIPLKLPCGHSYCEVCLTEYESNNHKVKCFLENIEYEMSVSSLVIAYDYFKMIMEKTPESSNLSYMCSKHKKKTIEFVCDEHRVFMCCLCLWDHADHKKSNKDIFTRGASARYK